MRFLTTERLGPKRELTPEGFLLCRDVPIARTGVQLYGPGEVPVTPGRDGIIRIERTDDQVFRDETIASFAGKPLVDEHPMGPGEDTDPDGWDVHPANWRELARGVVQNPRRGTDADGDLLLADILVTDATTIRAVLDGKTELSCGYSADYEELEPGRGRQLNIIGNHVALVDRGRCGARCSIGDEDMTMTRDGAPADRWTKFIDGIRKAFKSGDERALDEALRARDELVDPEAGGSATHLHIHQGGERDDGEEKLGELRSMIEHTNSTLAQLAEVVNGLLTAGEKNTGDEGEGAPPDAAEEEEAEADQDTEEDLEAETADEAEEEEPEEPAEKTSTADKRGKGRDAKTRAKPKVKARDSAHLRERFDAVVSRAEILIPGVKVPTFDAKTPAAKTVDTICKFRRDVVRRVWADGARRAVLEPLVAGADLGKMLPRMTCDAVTAIFNAAAATVSAENNRHSLGSGRVQRATPVNSIADLNARNRQHYGQPTR